jgi:hypothetical protein
VNGHLTGTLITVKQPPTRLITLRPMAEWLTTFQEAGVDLLAYDGAACAAAAGPLAEAAQRLEADPDHYKLAGRAGRETRVIDVLRWAAEKCAQHPGATMTIRARNA